MLRSTMMITLGLAFAAPAAAAEPMLLGSGDYKGVKFDYTSRLADGDKIIIDGKFVKSTDKFSYVLKPNGLVEGSTGNTPVRFYVSRAQRDRIADQLRALREPNLSEARTSLSSGR